MAPKSAIRKIFNRHLARKMFDRLSGRGKQKTPGAARQPGVIRADKNFGTVMANSIAFHFQQECSVRLLKMKAVADAAGNFAQIIPVRSAESIGIVELIARISNVLRGEIYAELFAKRFSE